MPRYAIIDHNSGYVWGVTDAANPAEACGLIDDEVDPGNIRSYETHGPNSGALRGGGNGYHVHEVPNGFDVTDGQDPAQINAVERHKLVAQVTISDESQAP